MVSPAGWTLRSGAQHDLLGFCCVPATLTARLFVSSTSPPIWGTTPLSDRPRGPERIGRSDPEAEHGASLLWL